MSIRAIPRSTIRVERARILKLFESHARPAGRVRAAAAALDGAGEARMAERGMANAARPAVPAFPAIRRSASGCRCNRCPSLIAARLSASGAGRSVRRAPAAAGSARYPSDQAAGSASAALADGSPPLAPETHGGAARAGRNRRARPAAICRCAPR